MQNKKRVYGLLLALIFLDITIAIGVFFFPELWFKIFHGVPYIDPQGLLRRCGANWAAFGLIQILACLKWERKPYWLAIVAGVRFSDIFTDWTYLWFSSNITMFGRISLFVISPLNFAFGLYFLNTYKKLVNSPSSQLKLDSSNRD
ncbi:MAG: hypothetical protein JSW40_09825 [Candidatus Omnitrophota bacterium]|nr:MAG: hypothetical protein JSW40_09825 [Candidatus Omnitrophota bacterium]